MTTHHMSEKKPPQGRFFEWNEEDLKLIESLKRLAKNADGVSPLAVERRFSGPFLQLLKDAHHVLDGNLVVFYQWSEERGEYLGRSCAVRVHDVGEKCRLLETFFKIDGHSEQSV